VAPNLEDMEEPMEGTSKSKFPQDIPDFAADTKEWVAWAFGLPRPSPAIDFQEQHYLQRVERTEFDDQDKE
jgi:hypothetical protein